MEVKNNRENRSSQQRQIQSHHNLDRAKTKNKANQDKQSTSKNLTLDGGRLQKANHKAKADEENKNVYKILPAK